MLANFQHDRNAVFGKVDLTVRLCGKVEGEDGFAVNRNDGKGLLTAAAHQPKNKRQHNGDACNRSEDNVIPFFHTRVSPIGKNYPQYTKKHRVRQGRRFAESVKFWEGSGAGNLQRKKSVV